jgi:chromosome segregation ATPase
VEPAAQEAAPIEPPTPAAPAEAPPLAELPEDLNDAGVRAALAPLKTTVAGLEVPLLDVLAFASCRRMAAKGCRGRGFTVDGRRLIICGCATTGWKRAHAPVALTEEQAERTVPGLRQVPKDKIERLERLKRHLADEEAKLAAARAKNEAACEGIRGELTALQAEEAANRRGLVEAEAAKKLATSQLEEARARLEGLKTAIHETNTSTEHLTAQSGQFGARRIGLEARIKAERDKLIPYEKISTDRAKSLRQRVEEHLKRWPELREAAPS